MRSSLAALAAAGALVGVLGTSDVAWAAAPTEPCPSDGPCKPLRYETAVDLTVTGVTLGALAVSEAFKSELVPATCRWCDRRADGTDTLNGVDRGVRSALKWNDTGLAGGLSYVSAFIVAPVFSLGADAFAASHEGELKDLPVDSMIVIESTVVALAFNQAAKFAFVRERPFVHFKTPEDRLAERNADDNLSFFSGHTTLAFALASSAGTVASMRGHRLAPLVWGVGLTTAIASGYLRIAADKHYFTDVMTGAVVGSAFGFVIPYFFHGPRAPTVGGSTTALGVAPIHGGDLVTWSGVF